MIDRHHTLSITRQARLLNISRGTVYYRPRPVSSADLVMMRTLDELHLDHPFMGSRMLRDQLARYGLHAGRRHIRTLMRRMGIEALVPQPGTSQAAPGTRSTRTCCASWRSPAPTRSGRWTRPTFPWPGALCTSRPLWMWPRAASWRTRWRSRWRPATPPRFLSRPLPSTARPRSSIPTKAASSRRWSSPMSCWARAARCPWMAAGPGVTTCSLSACGAASSTNGCI